MAYKPENRQVYRTANGKEFNMDQFRQKNELSPAIGNIKVNGRGDELGPGGRIIKKRNEILNEYYKEMGKADEDPVTEKRSNTKPVSKEQSDTKSAPASSKTGNTMRSSNTTSSSKTSNTQTTKKTSDPKSKDTLETSEIEKEESNAKQSS